MDCRNFLPGFFQYFFFLVVHWINICMSVCINSWNLDQPITTKDLKWHHFSSRCLIFEGTEANMGRFILNVI